MRCYNIRKRIKIIIFGYLFLLSYFILSYSETFEKIASLLFEYETFELDELFLAIVLFLALLVYFSVAKLQQFKKINLELHHSITALKKAEKKIQKDKDLYNCIFESLHEGILVLDKTFRYTQWNRTMHKISGFSREEVINSGKKTWELFP